MSIVGQPMNRTDGPLKVRGEARYAAEFSLPRLVYAVIVQSTVASGRVLQIDEGTVTGSPGIILVMTHRNAPKLPQQGRAAVNPPAGRVMSLLQDDSVSYNGQPIAVVVADTFERAMAGASRLRVAYTPQPAELDFAKAKGSAYKPDKANKEPTDSGWGDISAGMRDAQSKIDATYATPMQTHNPMEPHATVAAWDGDSLTVYDSTQGVSGARTTIAKTFGIDAQKVRVISPFVGGGFGSKGSVWSHVLLAAMAAQMCGRPVKLALARTQTFGPVGGRPRTEQHIVLGARRGGELTALSHDSISHTSFLEDFVEPSAAQSRMLYATPNAMTTHRLVKLNVGTPTFQRAPGESTGTYALECAMDELAYELSMDPVELRLRNYAEQDPGKKLPWSSKSLRECYRGGAERFGWAHRKMQPRSMQQRHELIGWGFATATYPMNRSTASASAKILADGTALVVTGSQDIGTGTYTIMTQVAADALGLPPERVHFELGDSNMPESPGSGGSTTTASVTPAVQAACLAVLDKLIAAAIAAPDSPLTGAAREDVTASNGWLSLRSDASRREPYATVLARNGGQPVEATMKAEQGAEKDQYSMHSFGAVFVEVRVDAELGRVRVPRVVGRYGVGRIMNAKTANSQIVGGIVWGISMALLEHTQIDPNTGRVVNANLSEYHVPVNADIGSIDVSFVDEHDPFVNALGAKGIGEIGITGTAAAVANAIFHATGRRVRELPITLDRLL